MPHALKREAVGLALVAIAVAFSAWHAAPELRVERVPINDVVFHLAAAERMATAFERGEPFLDPWVSEWGFGYPVWSSYQPLPHLVAAAALKIFRGSGESTAVFAALLYALIGCFPFSVYIGARLLGLSPPAAGLGAMLVFATAAPSGDLERFGLGYGSVVWRGTGLYTQLFALHVFVLALGASRLALDSGLRGYRIGAAVLLALTAVSHIVFGYAAFVSVAAIAFVGPSGHRATRMVRLSSIVLPAALMLAWFVVPYVLAGSIANHSRWEGAQKWDSYGAPAILTALARGDFFDAKRVPVLSLLLTAGAATAIVAAVRRRDPLMQRLLSLAAVWLLLFFGRATWGHLVRLAFVPADLPMHRLQAPFELSAILLGAAGVARLIEWTWSKSRALAALTAGVAGLMLVPMARERAGYLDTNRAWGEASLIAYQGEKEDLEAAFGDVRDILERRPGRVSAGRANSWGRDFKLGSVPVFAFLSREHFDQASYLYHSMSRASDLLPVRNEQSPWHDKAFSIRAVVAPMNLAAPPHLKRVQARGRFVVYESSDEGYFGIADVAGHYTGLPSTVYDPELAWLNSPLPALGLVVSLDERLKSGVPLARWQPMPRPTPEQLAPAGNVISERKDDEVYSASVAMERPAYVLLKITWNPNLKAAVDGAEAPFYQVTPGFGAVPVSEGRHEIQVVYAPGSTRAVLLAAALAVPLLMWVILERGGQRAFEVAASERIAGLGRAIWRPAAPAVTVVGALAVVALRPLFRGQLIAGHDAAVYPPRIVEMARAFGDLHFPTIWAPDLSAGHGQPLFEFFPPLVYWSALPFRAIGLGTADSVQLGIAFWCLAGAAGMYRVTRLLDLPRFAAAGSAALWLFAAYLSLDLFVRSAFAEAVASATAPLVLWSLLRAASGPSARSVTLAAVAVALIPLSHNVATLFLLPACGLAAVAYAWALGRRAHAGKPSSTARVGAVAAAGVGGLGLSAWFWIPALVDIRNLHPERLLAVNVVEHFLHPAQLLWSPWGYGFSFPGRDDGMAFRIGPGLIALGIMGVVATRRSSDPARRTLGAIVGVLALMGAAASLTWTAAIWQRLAFLHVVQFPWRALMVPALFLPLLGGFALERMGRRWGVTIVAGSVALSLTQTEPKGYLTYDEEYYAPQSIAERGINTTTREEIEPRWSDVRPPYEPRGLVAVGESPLDVSIVSRSTTRQEYVATTVEAGVVEAATFCYPGWVVLVDGVEVPASPAPLSGRIQFALPAGQHQVVLELRRTPVVNSALVVSGVVLLVVGLGAGIGRESSTRQKRLVAAPGEIEQT